MTASNLENEPKGETAEGLILAPWRVTMRFVRLSLVRGEPSPWRKLQPSEVWRLYRATKESSICSLSVCITMKRTRVKESTIRYRCIAVIYVPAGHATQPPNIFLPKSQETFYSFDKELSNRAFPFGHVDTEAFHLIPRTFCKILKTYFSTKYFRSHLMLFFHKMANQ